MNKHVLASPHTWGRDKMKRDMDLIRRIMLRIEAKADLRHQTIEVDGEDEERVGHHIDMLYKAGFIDGIRSQTLSSSYGEVMVKDLSWEGHEFIGALKNDSVFGRIKEALSPAELATVSLTTLATVAKEMGAQWLRQKVGLE